MKIDLTQGLKNLKGEVLKEGETEFTLGIALSNILIGSKTGGKMKLYILAQSCAIDKELDVDVADLGLIKSAVESTENYNNMVTGQVLVLLDSLK